MTGLARGGRLTPIITVAMLALALLVLGMAAHDAGRERWRAETIVRVEDDVTASRTQLGRITVGLLQSPAVRDRVAADAGIASASVADRTTAEASAAEPRNIAVSASADDREGSVALLTGLIDAAEAAGPRIRWSSAEPTAGRDEPPATLLALLALVGAGAFGGAVAFLLMAVRSDGTRRLLDIAASAALTLAALVCASSITGGDPRWFALNVALAPLLAVGLALAGRRIPDRVLLGGLAAGLSGLAVWSSVIWLSGSATTVGVSLGDEVQRRIFPSSFGHPGHYGVALALLVPFAVAGIWTGGRVRRALFAVAAVLGTIALALTFARTAWLAAVIGAFIAMPTLRARVWSVVVAVAAVAPLAPLLLSRATTSDLTDNVRLDIWQRALEIIAEHPWLGLGVGGFGLHAEPVFLPLSAARPGHAHHLFLTVAAESGLPALAALAIGVGALALALLVGRPAVRRGRDDRAALARACLGALTAMVVAGLFDVAVYQRYTLVIAGLVGGVAGIVVSRLADDLSPSPDARPARAVTRARAGRA